MKIFPVVALVISCLIISCSNDDKQKGQHVWKDQTETIKQAHDVSDLMNKATEQQQKTLDDQNR